MYQNRMTNYAVLEEMLQGKVIAYITGDRPGFETRIAPDVIDPFISHLDKIGPVDRIILYLYTRGGDISAAWNIVNLLRMYCEDLVVVVPHKAHSSGTIISLGANKIIMTKQATLSPIDPSLNTLLNPVIPNHPQNLTADVSVEAVKGYIELAKEEFNIHGEKTMGDILIKLSDYVHPLVLGQVYRSRAQIKMIASKLLKNQVSDQVQMNKMIDFLCSDSGSHDYTINRREAKEELGLKIEIPSPEAYKIIKEIYDDFSDELGLGQLFNPQNVQGEYAVKRGFIESLDGGCDFFVTEGMNSIVSVPNGTALQREIIFEGWKHDNCEAEPVEQLPTVEEGEVIYETDNSFSL